MRTGAKILILADGPPIPASACDRLRRGRFTLVLDGAAERVRRQGWVPDAIAGDFDAVRESTLRHFAALGTKLLPLPDQNFTDLEKALAWCIESRPKSIWIAQSLGGRIDHTFANLSLLRRFFRPGREILLYHEGEVLRFARHQKIRLVGRAGRRVAVLPFPSCRVRSSGLAYEMKGMQLRLGVRASIANQASRKAVRLDIQGEALVVEEGRLDEKSER